jgi:hypothetical protein
MTTKEHIKAVMEGRPYKTPEKAINETIEGLVHSALIVRASEDGTLLTPEARALDAIGVQVERELRVRADMIRALTDRLITVETERNMVAAELAARRQEQYTKELQEPEKLAAGQTVHITIPAGAEQPA